MKAVVGERHFFAYRHAGQKKPSFVHFKGLTESSPNHLLLSDVLFSPSGVRKPFMEQRVWNFRFINMGRETELSHCLQRCEHVNFLPVKLWKESTILSVHSQVMTPEKQVEMSTDENPGVHVLFSFLPRLDPLATQLESKCEISWAPITGSQLSHYFFSPQPPQP